MCNKVGVCEWALPLNGPFSIALAAKAGFEGIQIGDLGGAGMGFPMNNKYIQEGYLQAAADYHVEIQALHPYGLQREGTMLCPLSTSQGQEGMLSVSKCIDACVDMKIPKLMLSSFFATLVRNDWDFDIFAQHLKYACELGREKGIQIVYESVLTVDRILKMIDVVGEDLKICYDTLNPIRWGTGNPRDEIRKLGKERIDHFHVKDAPFDLKGYSLIGQGRADFMGIVDAIHEIGYEGWFVSENYYSLLSVANRDDFISLAAKDVQMIKMIWSNHSAG